jgi:hypothetical protein
MWNYCTISFKKNFMSTIVADINAEVPIENGNFEKSIFLREIDFGRWWNIFVHVSTPLGASRFSLEVGEQRTTHNTF